MIQRKQSLWLLIAALLNFCVLFFDVYRWRETINGADTLQQLKIANHFPSLVMLLVISSLPLVTIFMYRQRKRQINLIVVTIIATISFTSLMLYRVNVVANQTPPPVGGTYWIGSALPEIAILFLILAMLAIRKDEKLVKSMDRLR